MSPSQFHDDQQARKEINGPRPSPLKINKDSHFIQKPSSSAHSSSSTSPSSLSAVAATASVKQQHQQQRQPPVIIYTHSPKIIHTQARDFMALVQKLTGLSRSDDQPVQPQPQESGQVSSSERNNFNTRAGDDTESSSLVTDGNCGGGGGDVQVIIANLVFLLGLSV
uniref:VQ domain-containing protein n=1 Tax=Nelumbo nucifera TaxID=4432 RepID=A0A822YS63_NELNU|nr:TPA_asm: hypothetical protein HUJ06_006007 [Nelumbo nucifera]